MVHTSPNTTFLHGSLGGSMSDTSTTSHYMCITISILRTNYITTIRRMKFNSSIYWTHWSGMEIMRSSGKLSVEAGGCLARRHARVQRGVGNGDGHAGSQSGPTANVTCTRSPVSGVLRHPQDIRLTGQGEMSGGPERVWGGGEPNPPTQLLLVMAESSAKDW